MNYPNRLPGETPPNNLDLIKGGANRLLLDAESGLWGHGPEGLTDRDTAYALSNEDNSFYMLGLSLSELGLAVSMRQYSQTEVNDDPNPIVMALDLGEHAAAPISSISLVSFFEIAEGTLDIVDATREVDIDASDDELTIMLKIMNDDGLEEVALDDYTSLTYRATKLDHLRSALRAQYKAFLRVVGDSQDHRDFTHQYFFGIRPDSE